MHFFCQSTFLSVDVSAHIHSNCCRQCVYSPKVDIPPTLVDHDRKPATAAAVAAGPAADAGKTPQHHEQPMSCRKNAQGMPIPSCKDPELPQECPRNAHS
jgi:hypothetical protein